MCTNVNTDAKEVEKEVQEQEYFRVAYLRINIFLQITTNLFKYSVHKYTHESKVYICIYISRATRNFCGTETKIWAGFWAGWQC